MVSLRDGFSRSLIAVFEGAIFTPAIYEVQKQLGTTEVISNLSIACYTISTALMPLQWSALSERYGRKPVYLASLIICLLASIALVFTPEVGIAWLIVWRVFQGCGACAAFSVGAGTISDVYRIEQRGRACGYRIVFARGCQAQHLSSSRDQQSWTSGRRFNCPSKWVLAWILPVFPSTLILVFQSAAP